MSPISKFLRILRIEKGENAKQMADKLKISPSYLSAIENGKRAIPSSFQAAVIKKYSLTEDRQKEFARAIQDSSFSLKMDFGANASKHDAKQMKVKEIVFALAKNEVPDEIIDQMFALIRN